MKDPITRTIYKWVMIRTTKHKTYLNITAFPIDDVVKETSLRVHVRLNVK